MRTGKQATELFASTTAAKKNAPVKQSAPADNAKASRRGRPEIDRAPTVPATVILYETQIVQLDEITNQVRARSRKVIKRADVIRGILAAVLAAGLDLATATTEDEIRATVAARLRAK